MRSACKTKCSSTTLAYEGVDLIVVDITKGLLIPNISSPSNIILVWNKHVTIIVESNFELACSLLHNNVTLIVFAPKFKEIRGDAEILVLA